MSLREGMGKKKKKGTKKAFLPDLASDKSAIICY